MIPTYKVGWYLMPDLSRSGYLTCAKGRRVVSKALPLRQTRSEALHDLANWLGDRAGCSGPAVYTELLRQHARVRAELKQFSEVPSGD